jgi:hypothetical protein
MIKTALTLYLDITHNQLVTSLTDPTPFTIPAHYYGQVLAVNLYPVVPVSGSAAKFPGSSPCYTAFNATLVTLLLNVGIGAADGSYAPLFQSLAATGAGAGDFSSWTWQNDAANLGYFSGLLSFFTSATNSFAGMKTGGFATAMTGVGSISTTLQFEIADAANTGSNNFVIEYSGQLTVYQPVVSPTPIAAAFTLPPATFLTRAECLAMFVQWANNGAGKTIALTSPSGAHQRVIGVNNDGTAEDNMI